MEKYKLYRVDFSVSGPGYIHEKALDFLAIGPGEAIEEARKFVFNETGEHASRCKAKLVKSWEDKNENLFGSIL